MATMRAVRLHSYGGPDVLVLEEVDRPQVGAQLTQIAALIGTGRKCLDILSSFVSAAVVAAIQFLPLRSACWTMPCSGTSPGCSGQERVKTLVRSGSHAASHPRARLHPRPS